MKRDDVVNQTAAEILELSTGKDDFDESLPTVKAFYRRIARWHLKKLKEKEGRN